MILPVSREKNNPSVMVKILVASVVLLCVSLQAKPREEVIVIEGKRLKSEAAYRMDSMVYLPFRVPRGVTGIKIEKEFAGQPSGR